MNVYETLNLFWKLLYSCGSLIKIMEVSIDKHSFTCLVLVKSKWFSSGDPFERLYSIFGLFLFDHCKSDIEIVNCPRVTAQRLGRSRY